MSQKNNSACEKIGEVGRSQVGFEALKVVASGGKRTTPGIPTWSPTVVLTRPDDA